MMKRLLVSVVLVLAGLLMVVMSAVSVARAQGVVNSPEVVDVIERAGKRGEEVVEENTELEEGVVAEETQEATVVVMGEGGPRESDYYLAYPGILPDHPLYFVKMIRDRVRMVLTRDKLAKVELNLLFADKRVGAAEVLVRGGKDNLGAETALKAEKYLFEASGLLSSVEGGELWARLADARVKHEEVLLNLKDEVDDGDRNVIESALEINMQIKERVVNDGGEVSSEEESGEMEKVPAEEEEESVEIMM